MTIKCQNSLTPGANILSYLNQYDAIIWDFDGVIKESVSAKEDVFVSLFPEYSPYLQNRIRVHHRSHSGISRFVKIPIYHSFGHSFKLSDRQLKYYCQTFADRVVSKVVASPYVPGFVSNIIPFIQLHNSFLVTATPQAEISEILSSLSLTNLFIDCFGSPSPKVSIFKKLGYSLDLTKSVYVGDSISDYTSASTVGLNFLFRKHMLNSFDSLPSNQVYFHDFL